MQEAAGLIKSKKDERKALGIYRDIADLYDEPAKDDKELATAVEEAKKALGESEPKK